jgi:hypothetical protein
MRGIYYTEGNMGITMCARISMLALLEMTITTVVSVMHFLELCIIYLKVIEVIIR